MVSTSTPATGTCPRECVAEATMRGGFNAPLEYVEIQMRSAILCTCRCMTSFAIGSMGAADGAWTRRRGW